MITGQLFTMPHTVDSRESVTPGEFVLDKENNVGGFISESNYDTFTICLFEPNPVPEGATLVKERLSREVVAEMLITIANHVEGVREKWVDVLTRQKLLYEVLPEGGKLS